MIPMAELITNILMALALGAVGLFALQWVYKVLEKRENATGTPGERQTRLKIILRVTRNLLQVLVISIVLMMILNEAGVNIAPLLASAGVVGLALSLGAQTLIKDFLGGIFILAENQFSVGDYLTLGEVSGAVERITLRATYLRDIEGRLHLVPNGDIRTVTNQTNQWAQVVISLNVDFEADIQQVVGALEEAARAVQADAEVADDLIEAPRTLGWTGFSDWAVQVQIIVKTRPGRQWAVGRAVRRAMLDAFQRADVRVAIPRQRIVAAGGPEETEAEEQVN